MEKKKEYYDVIIIGGGPAGMTAAIYCGRARLRTLVIEKSLMGGMVTYTSEVENYPGFVEPVGGTELMQMFDKQMRRFGVDVKLTDVKNVAVSGVTKIVSTFRTDYHASSVIIATGNKPRLSGAKNEEKFLNGRGLSFCAVCDAPQAKDKRVMVVGSGDASIEEGLFLTKFAQKVTVSVRRNEGDLRANRISAERAMANPRMEFKWNTIINSFEGSETLHAVILQNTLTGELVSVPVEFCFLFIGYVPNTSLFINLLELNKAGYILSNENMETCIPGIYAAGDCRAKKLRQIATAVGDGAIAGCMAEKYISHLPMVGKSA